MSKGKLVSSTSSTAKYDTHCNSDAYNFLTHIRKQSDAENNPMVDCQEAVGEFLRKPGMTEEIIVQAAETLSDLILKDPAKADPKAFRRMAKFFIHGPVADASMERRAGEFKEYNVSQVMTTTALALTGYMASKSEITQEEEGMMWQAIEASKQYTLTGSTVHKMQKTLQYAA